MARDYRVKRWKVTFSYQRPGHPLWGSQRIEFVSAPTRFLALLAARDEAHGYSRWRQEGCVREQITLASH